MQNDKTTLRDLAVFPADGSGGVFALIDRTTTQAGRDTLRKHLLNPPESYEQLVAVQDTIKFWSVHTELWPVVILNGTIVMLDKFFESAEGASAPPSGLAAMLTPTFQKLFNKREYFFTKFSLSHLCDFLKGCLQLTAVADMPDVPVRLLTELNKMKGNLEHKLINELIEISEHTPFATLARLQYHARREMKNTIYRLIASYALLDAWQSMARATNEHKLVFADLAPELPVLLEGEAIYHPLLSTPVSYDFSFGAGKNFLLLTGANMSGKTTFLGL